MAYGLLINYAGVPYEISSLFPDNGLASLAAVLKNENHTVQIIDYSTTTTIREVFGSEVRKALIPIAPVVFGERMLNDAEIASLLEIEGEIKKNERSFLDRQIIELSKSIIDNNVRWIGFKLWMSGTQQSMHIASKLKELFPHLKIFAGGPSIDLFQEAIIEKFSFIDALIFSEAEESLPQLLKWMDGKLDISEISSVIYKTEQGIVKAPVKRIEKLDALPFPVYDEDVYNAMAGNQKMKIFCFDESRGCIMGCAFCPDVNKYKKQRIEKSAKRCVDEIAYLQEKYKTAYFRFSGSNTSISLLEEIADEIISRELSIKFSVFSSAIGLKSKTVEKLAKAGLIGIFIGAESADASQLKQYLKKGTSPDKIRNIVDCCKKYNIFVSLSMIYPTPFSNESTLHKNITFILDCLKGYEKCSVPHFPAGLYPYTQWFENLEEFGFSLQCPTKTDYINEVLFYSYNVVLPRYLWKDLPYTLNGKTFKELLLDTFKMSVSIKNNGIIPYLPEANLMMAPLLGYDDYKVFAKDMNIAMFTGDSSKIEMWNGKFNSAAKQIHRK